MLGGYHSLGPGGYGGTPLGECCRWSSAAATSANHRAVPAAADAGGRPPPDLRQHREFFPTQQGRRKRRAAAAGRLHAGRPGPARRHVLATCAGPQCGRHARAGRAAARSRPDRRFRRRYDAQLAAGAAGPRPGVALPAVLGADGPLAGRPVGAVEAKASVAARPTRRPTSRASRSTSRPSSATRTARAPPTPAAIVEGRPRCWAAVQRRNIGALSHRAPAPAATTAAFQPRTAGGYEISVAARISAT